MDIISAVLQISMFVICCGQVFQDVNSKTCWDDEFHARCPSPQKILIMQARYGHIEISKCVGEIFATWGSLGCYANVTDIVAARCDAKDRCRIAVQDSEIVASKECSTGLPMYMDISYMCIPETYRMQSCSPLRVNRQLQYILSTDLWDQHCLIDSDQNVNVAVEAATNMKIKLRLRSIKMNSGSKIVVHYGEGKEVNLELKNEEITEIQADNLMITLGSQEDIFLIGYQAFGCDDVVAPVHAWVSREGDIATVGCHHSEYEWKMSCVGSKWIGPRSNCTEKKIDIIKSTPTPEKNDIQTKRKQFLTTDILFALIIGLTILLCAIVITVGYVCLKRAKYTYEAKSAPYEMATMMSDPSNTATWQKAKLQGNNDTLILPVNALQGQTLQLR